MSNDMWKINNQIKLSMKDYINGKRSFHELIDAVKKREQLLKSSSFNKRYGK